MGIGEATDIVTGILRGYGKDVSELGHVNDVLVSTFQRTNSELTDLGVAFRYVGPIARSAGVSFEETSAALGILSNAGIKGSMAGTSLRGAISKLLDPTAKAKKVIQELGLQVTDSHGRLLPLVDIVAQLEVHADKTSAFMTLFGQRAGPAMAALATQGADALRKLTTEISNSGGVAQKVADTQVRGLQGAWIKMQNAGEALKITVGERLAPAFTLLADTATGVMQAMSTMPESLKDTLSNFGGLLMVIGPVTLALGAFLSMIGFINTALGISLLPILGKIALAFAVFEIAKSVTNWLLDLHPAIRGTVDWLVQLTMKLWGVQAALDMYNAKLAKGVNVQDTWTDAQKASFAEHLKNQEVMKVQQEMYERLGIGVKKVADETGKATSINKTWSEADIAAKMDAIDEADKLAKATQLIGEEITDLPNAERIIAYADAQDKAAKAAEKHREDLIKLKETYAEILDIMTKAQSVAFEQGLGAGFVIPDLAKLRGPQDPNEGPLGLAISGLPNAMEQASKMLSQGFSPQHIKDKLMTGLKLTDAEAESVLRALGKELPKVAKSSFQTAFDDLPKTILGAIQGGGSISGAVGASLMGGIGEDVGKKVADKIGGKLGSTIGGFMGPLGSMAGSLIGGLVGKGIGKISEALGIGGNKTIMQVNDLRDAFFQAQGGFEQFSQKMAAVSDEDWAKKIFDAKTVEDFNRLVSEAKMLLDTQSMAQEALNDAVERYGFSLEELPLKMRQDEVNANFAQILQDFELLKAAGFDTGLLLQKLGPNMSEFVNQAISAGATIPSAMRPMLEQMAKAGTLLHEDGTAFTEAEVAGLTFAETMDEKFTTLIDKITQMVNALLGLPTDVNTNINVHTNYTSSGNPDGGRRPVDEEFATGGIVTSPTVAMVGEGGAEAITPIGDVASLFDQSQQSTTAELSPAAAKAIARAVRDAMIQANA